MVIWMIPIARTSLVVSATSSCVPTYVVTLFLIIDNVLTTSQSVLRVKTRLLKYGVLVYNCYRLL